MKDVSTWLDCHVSKSTPDLFGECDRTIQFRYVSVDCCWHLGRFGPMRYVENYSPFKSKDTWRTPPAKPTRKVISACGRGGTVSHEYPSKVGVASAEIVDRLCWNCLRVLQEFVAQLLETGPARQRQQKVEQLLRFADDATKLELLPSSLCPDEELTQLVDYLDDNGPTASYHAAALVMSLQLELNQ